ncbi:MAG TPA: hypothetical protein DCX27_11345 [Balneola sp.]|nr:hypothetical protein [Balneola sp.]
MKYNSINTIAGFDRLTYRGEFRINDTKGSHLLYDRGDIVLYEGKTHIANENVSGVFPAFDKETRWYCLAGNSVFIQKETPLGGNGGDEWFNSSTGKTYRYLKDSSGEQWVEI